jgi:Protein of unknown function (DUF3105)
VSSRKEQKEKLRQERLAKEQAAAAAEKRRRMMGFGVGGVLAVAAIVAVVVAVAAGGGGDDGPSRSGSDGPRTPIPAQRQDNLQAAAREAGCTLRSFTPGANDRQHTEDRVNYQQNPPVFGPHNPQWASDGNYVGQGAPGTENVVHALEHGRVVIWYQPNLPARQISQLETLFAEPIEGKPEGYKQLLVERPNMPFQVAATSWGQQLGCRQFNNQVFDALRTFRAAYVDKGPESVPFPE